jgi:hypothetical protein
METYSSLVLFFPLLGSKSSKSHIDNFSQHEFFICFQLHPSHSPPPHPAHPLYIYLEAGIFLKVLFLVVAGGMQLHKGAWHYGNLIKRGTIKRSCR